MDVVLAFPRVFGFPITTPTQGKQPLRRDLQQELYPLAWKQSSPNVGKRASSGEEEAANQRVYTSLYLEGLC